MDLDLQPFDAAEFITSDQEVRWFLESTLEDGEVADLVHALKTVARARTSEAVASAAGLTVVEFERALEDSEHPDMAMIVKILKGLGLRLVVEPIEPEADAA